MAKKSPSKKKHTKRRKRLNPKRVTINSCASNPNPLILSKKNGDQALWRSGDGGTYAVVFFPDPPNYPYGSPFNDAVFIVEPTGTTPSGPIRRNAKYDFDYKYRVVGDNGCDIDPIIHIGP